MIDPDGVHWLKDDTALERICAEVVVQAIKEAMGKGLMNGERRYQEIIQESAQSWLVSKEAAFFIEAAGYEPRGVHDWIESGCHEPNTKRSEKSRKDPDSDLYQAVTRILSKKRRIKEF